MNASYLKLESISLVPPENSLMCNVDFNKLNKTSSDVIKSVSKKEFLHSFDSSSH